jgi:hypothetical protein
MQRDTPRVIAELGQRISKPIDMLRMGELRDSRLRLRTRMRLRLNRLGGALLGGLLPKI